MLTVLNCIVYEHDLRLVGLAVVVCALATFTAISLLHHMRRSEGRSGLVWLAVSATTTGFGIWATHFIASHIGNRVDCTRRAVRRNCVAGWPAPRRHPMEDSRRAAADTGHLQPSLHRHGSGLAAARSDCRAVSNGLAVGHARDRRGPRQLYHRSPHICRCSARSTRPPTRRARSRTHARACERGRRRCRARG